MTSLDITRLRAEAFSSFSGPALRRASWATKQLKCVGIAVPQAAASRGRIIDTIFLVLLALWFQPAVCPGADWSDGFEADPAGASPDTNAWSVMASDGSTVLVSDAVAYNGESWPRSSIHSVQLCASATGSPVLSRSCAGDATQLQRVTWSCLTSNVNVSALSLDVCNPSSQIYCGVSLAVNGNYACRTAKGGWADTGVSFSPGEWHRLNLLLDYTNQMYSVYEQGMPVAINLPFVTNQMPAYVPGKIVFTGPTLNKPGTTYLDEVKVEFLQDGSGLQAAINQAAWQGRLDLTPGSCYHMTNTLFLPGHFVLNGNGATLRMAPFTQLSVLANNDWNAGNQNLVVSNLVIDGNEFDQAVNPQNNGATRYAAVDASQVDNVGAYFKNTTGLLVSDVTFKNIPNEAMLLLASQAATVINCVFTNCALLSISNNLTQCALYTRWTTGSFFLNNRVFDCFEGGLCLGTLSSSNVMAGNYSTNTAGGEGFFVGQSSYNWVVGNTNLNSAYLGDPLNYPPENSKYWGSGAGIALQGVGHAELTVGNAIGYNYIWRTGAEGINSLTASNTLIFGNEVYAANCFGHGNPAGAILVSATPQARVFDNIIQSNACRAIAILSSKNCDITNNLVAPANTLNGIYLSNSSGVNTNANYAEDPITNQTGNQEIVVDNADASGVAITGNWVSSTSTPGYYGTNYLHDDNTGFAGGKRVQYTPTFPMNGKYAVFLDWTANFNRATNTPVDVLFQGGTNTFRLNQTSAGSQWNWMGNFKFSADNSAGVVVRNDSASGYVIADAVRFAPIVPAPETPTNLTAVAMANQVSLTWNAATGAACYHIKRSNSSDGPFLTIGTSYLNRYTDFAVTNEVTYYYQVTAVNPGGESSDSDSMVVTPVCSPVVPAGLRTIPTGVATQIAFTWSPLPGAASFNVKRASSSGGPYVFLNNTTGIGYLDTNVIAGRLYYYVVSAVNPCGVEGANSAELATTTGIIVDNADNSGVTVTGAWYYGSGSGYFGSNYLQDGNAGGGKSVRFTPNLPLPGNYDVYLWWVASSNRATNVPVDVVSPAGTNNILIDEAAIGSIWHKLGNYAFNAGASGSVLISDNGATGYVVADAVQFILTTPAPAVPLNLSFNRAAGELSLSWPAGVTGYRVESATNLTPPVTWETVTTISNNQQSILLTPRAGTAFYRLRSP